MKEILELFGYGVIGICIGYGLTQLIEFVYYKLFKK
jgi:hypothetical protein